MNRAVNVLGKEHSRALLGAFIMTGCDHIGVIKGLTKSRCFNGYPDNLPRDNSPRDNLPRDNLPRDDSPRVILCL